MKIITPFEAKLHVKKVVVPDSVFGAINTLIIKQVEQLHHFDHTTTIEFNLYQLYSEWVKTQSGWKQDGDATEFKDFEPMIMESIRAGQFDELLSKVGWNVTTSQARTPGSVLEFAIYAQQVALN